MRSNLIVSENLRPAISQSVGKDEALINQMRSSSDICQLNLLIDQAKVLRISSKFIQYSFSKEFYSLRHENKTNIRVISLNVNEISSF